MHITGVEFNLQRVPQGSVLGHKLFLLYINEICKVSDVFNFVLFADDTNVYCSGENLEQLIKVVERELHKLKSWFDSNKLFLNLSKTKFMVFSNKMMDNNIQIKIDNLLERVNYIKFLGVIIGHKLSWTYHIQNVQKKISKTIAILYKVQYILNKNELYILYSSLITPYLTYGVEIWGNTYKSRTTPVFLLQKKVIRLITQSPYNTPTNPLFIQLKTLKCYDLVDLCTAKLIYKAKQQTLPQSLQAMFSVRESNYDLSGTYMFNKPYCRTKLSSNCPSNKGVQLWNSFPDEIKMATSLPQFKILYKRMVIKRYTQ